VTVDNFKEIFKIPVADFAPTFTEVFGEDCTCGHCNLYVIKNVKDELKRIKNQELKDELRSDLQFLQFTDSPANFDATKSFWIKKQTEMVDVSSFIHSFNNEYLDQRSGWFEGLAPGY